jgi:hypothetical protein
MDACVLELTPAEKTAAAPTSDHSATRWLRFALLATITIGVAWRLVRYFGGFPIWGDEAMLLLNLLDRDYAGLTQHLRYNQVAPLFFLWLEKTSLLVFGPSEWSLHLVPFLAGLAALWIFWRTCRASFSSLIAGFAVAILAVSYYPVRHSCEVKPYAFDLLYAVMFAWLALGHLRHPQTSRWLIGLAAVTPIAVFSSYTSVFVGGAVSIVLLPRIWHATWTQWSLYLIFNITLCGSFLLHLLMVGHEQTDAETAQRTHDFLRNYWKDAFPPESLLDWPLWLIKVHTGNMLAYPLGANHGGSTLTFLLVTLGSIALWRQRQRSLLALCWLPFALNLVAAILGKYPFGDSARITLHLAPFICIMMAHGLAQIVDRIRAPVWQKRVQRAIFAILFGCGAVGVARDLAKPYKTEHDRDVRRLVRDLRRQVADGEPVVLCHERDARLIAEFVWYFRTQTWHLEWLGTAPLQATDQSCWLVLCSNRELSVADVTGQIGGRADEWRVVGSEMRCVPPENDKIAPMYCRWVHMVRAGT